MDAKKQLIIHASVKQDDVDRLSWLCKEKKMKKSAVIREAIEKLYNEAIFFKHLPQATFTVEEFEELIPHGED